MVARRGEMCQFVRSRAGGGFYETWMIRAGCPIEKWPNKSDAGFHDGY
jgi:hypothetical protein